MVGLSPPSKDHAIMEDHARLTRAQIEALKLIRGAAMYRRLGGYRGRGTKLIKLKTFDALRLRRLVKVQWGRCFITYDGHLWLAQEGRRK